VLSANVHRRHLSVAQRAIIGARLATLAIGANQHREGRSVDLPSRAEAAALVGVSVPTIKRARRVLQSGDADLIAACERGEP